MKFTYQKTSGITKKELFDTAQKKDVYLIIKQMQSALLKRYETEYASFFLPFDDAVLKQVKEVVKEKQNLNPQLLIVVGIGGSNLGTKAVHEALQGKFYNETDPELKVYFADTVDSDSIAHIMKIMEKVIFKSGTVILNVVTKSGTTTETVANFYVLLELLKKYHPNNYHEYVVVTTDKDSPLYVTAKQEQFTVLEVPQKVGGRYSVFSAVSLFPLSLMGVNCAQLLQGARHMVECCMQEDIKDNPALISALLLYIHNNRGLTICDMFLFSSDLESVGGWYRQLMAESIGKEYSKSGNQIFAGITPTVSIGSNDLHSVAQLYLGGPRDKFTTFITVQKNKHSVMIPAESTIHLAGKTFTEIMNALSTGTQTAYLKNKRPFCLIELSKKDERYIGQLLQFKMLEIMYLGYLLELNSFDQPHVELYKREAKLLLLS